MADMRLSDKLKMALVPGFFIKALTPPFMLGDAKYPKMPWNSFGSSREAAKEFVNQRRNSLARHFVAVQSGEQYDAEGCAHYACIAWNALVVLYYEVVVLGTMQIYNLDLQVSIDKYNKENKNVKNSISKVSFPTGHVAHWFTAMTTDKDEDLVETFRAGLENYEDKMYYLASPYSHPDPVVKEFRYILIEAIAAKLYAAGFMLVEPIGSSHPKALKFNLPQGYEYWKKRDRAMIERCDGIIVAMLQGFDTSVGVTDEIEYAKSLGKPVLYLKPANLLESLHEHVELGA